MTGFKDGASSEGFGSNTDTESKSNSDANDGDADIGSPGTSIGADSSPDPRDDQNVRKIVPSPTGGSLPWIYDRASITDGREKTVQLHLLQSSLERERNQKSAIEEVVGEGVKKADLREAALLVGLKHVDEVADQLREWGYDVE